MAGVVGNVFANIPSRIDKELFEPVAGQGEVLIERILSKGHSSPDSGWYDQDLNEWVLVLRGEATLDFVDTQEVRLKAGDYIEIPAHTRHRVSWTHPNIETVWLAVHYPAD